MDIYVTHVFNIYMAVCSLNKFKAQNVMMC